MASSPCFRFLRLMVPYQSIRGEFLGHPLVHLHLLQIPPLQCLLLICFLQSLCKLLIVKRHSKKSEGTNVSANSVLMTLCQLALKCIWALQWCQLSGFNSEMPGLSPSLSLLITDICMISIIICKSYNFPFFSHKAHVTCQLPSCLVSHCLWVSKIWLHFHLLSTAIV